MASIESFSLLHQSRRCMLKQALLVLVDAVRRVGTADRNHEIEIDKETSKRGALPENAYLIRSK